MSTRYGSRERRATRKATGTPAVLSEQPSVERGRLATIRERRDYLTARISAKQEVGWETVWDERERDALTWVLEWFGAA